MHTFIVYCVTQITNQHVTHSPLFLICWCVMLKPFLGADFLPGNWGPLQTQSLSPFSHSPLRILQTLPPILWLWQSSKIRTYACGLISKSVGSWLLPWCEIDLSPNALGFCSFHSLDIQVVLWSYPRLTANSGPKSCSHEPWASWDCSGHLPTERGFVFCRFYVCSLFLIIYTHVTLLLTLKDFLFVDLFATRRPYSTIVEGHFGRTGLSKEYTFLVTML